MFKNKTRSPLTIDQVSLGHKERGNSQLQRPDSAPRSPGEVDAAGGLRPPLPRIDRGSLASRTDPLLNEFLDETSREE